MSKNLEIETKALISKTDYENVIRNYKNAKSYCQTNYYISSNEMRQKVDTYGLRVRRKNKKYQLTLKVRENIGKTEINQQILQKAFTKLKYFNVFPDGEVAEYLTQNHICDINNLAIIGKMKTTRTDIKFLSSLISIDKSKYNHKVDYEIECEDDDFDTACKNLEDFANQNKLKIQKSELTKLARFLNSK